MAAHWTDRLSEYVDGDLAPAERAEAEAHLSACAECSRVVEELRAVSRRARALPALAPEADLWPAIASRLGEPERAAAPAPLDLAAHRAARDRRRWSFSLPQLAAAAAALVAVTGALTWFALTRSAGPAPGAGPAAPLAPGSAPRATGTPSLEDRPATVADFGVAEYDATIHQLEEALRANHSRLEPRTVRVVEENLALIDQAIEQARAALAADPASSYLNAHLASTMRRKVDLLKRLTALAGQRT